jgi:hypothetical protein
MEVLGVGMTGLLAHAAQRPCIICGGTPAGVAVYVAEGEAAQRLGAAPGTPRAIPYSLCAAHPPGAKNAARAERLLEAIVAAEPPTIFRASQLKRITFFGTDEA